MKRASFIERVAGWNRESRLAVGKAVGTVLILAIAGVFAGCGGDSRESESDTFYLNINTEPNSLDPVQISQQASWWVGHQIYEGLIGLDSAMNPAPAIASDWAVSDDGLTWTFTLRNDAYFCDNPAFPDGQGRAVTADDIRYSFERACTPGFSNGYWVFRGKVEGADDYYQSRVDTTAPDVEHVSGFRVESDSTFSIQLTDPFPPFIYLLTTPFCYIHAREAVEEYERDFFSNPVGTGPFRMSNWSPSQHIELVRNENYRRTDDDGAALPYLDRVVVSFIADPSTEFTEFRNGQVDVLTNVNAAFADDILTEDGTGLEEKYSDYTLHAGPGMSIEYYGFTLDTETEAGKKSPFATNRHLRKALNYAVDRQGIVRFVLSGLAHPAHYGPIPPSTPGFTGVEGYRYDPEKARAHLDSAGYPNGEGLDPFVLQISANQEKASVAEKVQEDFKNLGLEVEIRQIEHSAHLKMADEGRVAFWRTSWLADYPHAENFIANFYSPYWKPSGPNRARYKNQTVDSLYRAALAPDLSQDEWSSIYGQAEEIILDDAPWVFLYYSAVRQITQPWISGYSTNPLQLFDLSRVKKGAITESS